MDSFRICSTQNKPAPHLQSCYPKEKNHAQISDAHASKPDREYAKLALQGCCTNTAVRPYN